MTGIGILISGIRPTVCGLQAYHWQIIVHLAWFSSITHLSTLSFLRHYLINRPWQLYVRGALMGLLAALLGCAVYIAGHFDWDDQRNGREITVRPSYFARCVLGQEMQVGTLSFESMVFDLLLITYGYTIRLVKVWRRASNWPIRLSKRLMKVSYERLREWDPCHGQQSAGCYLWTGVLEPVIIAVPRVIYLQINIFTSYLAEVTTSPRDPASLICFSAWHISGPTHSIRCSGCSSPPSGGRSDSGASWQSIVPSRKTTGHSARSSPSCSWRRP